VERDRAAGYAYAAQLQAGLEVGRVQEEAERFAACWVPPRRIPARRPSSRSVRPPGWHRSSFPRARWASFSRRLPSLASAGTLPRIEVAIRDGRFTSDVVKPITYAEGKIAAARKAGRIALACGTRTPATCR